MTTTDAPLDIPLRSASRLDDYESFCRRVQRRTGLDLARYRRGQMERRLRTFAARRGTPTLEAYADRLVADPAELEALRDRITITVSQLWRDRDVWERLAREVEPALHRGATFRAWSVGCSFGAEVYTIAATLREIAGEAPVEVLGSDIDAGMIARARAGRFSAQEARSAPARTLARWFEREADGFAARGELRGIVRFEQQDVLTRDSGAERYELVVCRNVAIYFTDAIRDRLHARLAEQLSPGGHLLLGSSERVRDPHSLGLRAVDGALYRRVARGAA